MERGLATQGRLFHHADARPAQDEKDAGLLQHLVNNELEHRGDGVVPLDEINNREVILSIKIVFRIGGQAGFTKIVDGQD